MAQSLQEVAISVNTARSGRFATLRTMDEAKIRKAQGLRLKAARNAAGYRSAREAALQNEWKESSYAAHERGSRTIGQDDAERYASRFRFDGVEVTARGILFGDTDAPEQVIEGTHIVGVKGLISAGSIIETGSEQLSENENIYEISVPFPIEDGTIAFRVIGNSGYPKFDPDDVVLCSKFGENPERLVGSYAAVTTKSGDRYLKRILQGSKKGRYHLESYNAPLIPDASLQWAAGIISTVHARHWTQIVAASRQTSDPEKA
ncbi:S24 family peptidase [Methylobacterium sp. Leaf102]|uniref:S24 family peptidase n=1 Tax=Methylobacterium sp. Leaf102 TaxID=1736253 RepID=UPI001FCE0F79|nr:S24 family peptidase [Methylobacterium sp. Leaf102]